MMASKTTVMQPNLPNILTVTRILAIPVFVAFFYWPFGMGDASRFAVLALLFVAAAVTDWLDGMLARRWNQTSAFGAFLDPVADKLMVCAALVCLIEIGRVGAVVGIIIVGREITISALREWMASVGSRRGVAVNGLGKVKTAAQMVAIPLLLLTASPAGEVYHPLDFDWLPWLADVLILVASALTVVSMTVYLRAAWPDLRGR